ncbi:MAG: hypothetical protein GEU98_21445 [Pseudonocardiaceae bacterium]|nr:hypothetical protein [Pseudonocardiaceae bacterium]
MTEREAAAGWAPGNVDLITPNAGRVYDYFLGGACNFAADREFAKKVLEVLPEVRAAAVQNRAFLRRAVRLLAESGVRQFLDLGSGIPTVGNTHEVVQSVIPRARVVYVDNEAMAVAHSEMILQDNDCAAAVRADLRDPDAVLGSPEVARLLNLDEPVAILMVAVLHFVSDVEDPVGIVGKYREALAPGSYLLISHATSDDLPGSNPVGAMYDRTTTPASLRSRARVTELFNGWELVDPGVVYTSQWRPEAPEDVAQRPESALAYAGMARKP